MKKFSAILFFLISLQTTIVYASSGACSDHGGINCSAGAGTGGSVICNDGWSNSSVLFSSADECKISCTPPSASGCKTENDYGALQVQLNASGGYLGAGSSQTGALNQCRSEINAYQANLQVYNTCQANSSSNASVSSNADSYLKAKMQQYCVNTYGPQSFSNYSDKTCGCNSGYSLTAQGCLLKPKTNLGITTSTTIESCENNGVKGYKINGQCVFPTGTSTTIDLNKPITGILSDISSWQNVPTSTNQKIVSQFNRSLARGMRGNDIIQLQTLLQNLGYLPTSTKPTNYFGSLTQKAVIAFQLAHGITPPQGYVGPKTGATLIQTNY